MISYKIVTLGSSAAGKSSIITRYVNESFSETQLSTIGACFLVKIVKCADGSKIRLDIWDTCGSERFESIAPLYYRAAAAVLIVYDICDISSYERAKSWIETILDLRDDQKRQILVVLVGNKLDLQDRRAVQKEEVEEYSKQKRILFGEVSAKTNQGIDRLFGSIIRAFTSTLPNENQQESKKNDNNIVDLRATPTIATSGCCETRVPSFISTMHSHVKNSAIVQRISKSPGVITTPAILPSHKPIEEVIKLDINLSAEPHEEEDLPEIPLSEEPS